MAYSILVPHDFGPAADAALEWAAGLVRAAGGSIRLIHVIVLPPPIAMMEVPSVPYPQREEIEAAQAELAAAAARAGVAPTLDVIVAPQAGPAIVQAAKESGADLIVMGTHGRGPVRRALLGSVADYVTRHADCPVVTIRAAPRAQREAAASRPSSTG